MGAGHHIQFWYNPWSGHPPLKDLYPNLFACSVLKMLGFLIWLFLHQKGEVEAGVYISTELFITVCWEEVYTFFEFLYSKCQAVKSDNNLTWQLSRNGFFDVHSYYNSLSGPLIASFPWKNIWCVKVPKRVSFFL